MGIVKTLPLTVETPMAPFGILTRRHETLADEQRAFISYLKEEEEAR